MWTRPEALKSLSNAIVDVMGVILDHFVLILFFTGQKETKMSKNVAV